MNKVRVKQDRKNRTAKKGALQDANHLCLRPRSSATIDAPQNAPKDNSRGALNGSNAKLGAMNKVVVVKDAKDIKASDF